MEPADVCGHNQGMDCLSPADVVDDGTLWARAATGDGQAFGQLFERHADSVYNHCFRRTGSWDAAADTTAMVFLETWRRHREVQLSTSSILPWLLAVANNVLRRHRRAYRRHRHTLERLHPAECAVDHADEVAARVDDERTMRRILHLLAGMSIAEQEVLSLCVWSQLSYSDAAAVLGVPVGTVKSRLSRARSHLRALAAQAPTSTPSLKAGEGS